MKIHHARAHDESISGFLAICDYCGKEFRAENQPTTRNKTYCSEECWKKGYLSEPPTLEVDSRGYERLRVLHEGIEYSVYVHQLLAILEGEDPHRVFGPEHFVIHHENEIPWDNRPSNIEPMYHQEHSTKHNSNANGETIGIWKDKETLKQEIKRKSVIELSNEWGCSRRTIYRYLERYNIPLPTESEGEINV